MDGDDAGDRRDRRGIRQYGIGVVQERVLRFASSGSRDDPAGPREIINIGSNFGVVAFRGRSVYAGVKAGVHHLARALSLEWAKHGVTVNVVAPCITETESRRVILERPGYKEWATTQMLPAGRWNQPEDLVGAVLFLSSTMSDMVVGHVLMVDGGWTIH